MRLVQSTQDNLFVGDIRLAKNNRIIVTDHEFSELIGAHRITDGTFIDRGVPTQGEIANAAIFKTEETKDLLQGSGGTSIAISMDRVEGLGTAMGDKAAAQHTHVIDDVIGLPEALGGEINLPDREEGESLVLLFENGLV